MTGDGKVSRGERYGKNLRNTSNAVTEICQDSLLLNSRQLGTLSTVHLSRETSKPQSNLYLERYRDDGLTQHNGNLRIQSP